MVLTNAQLIVLGTDIRARAASMGWNFTNMFEEIAFWYNSMPDNDFYVWRTAVAPSEFAQAVMNGGGATQLDSLTAGKRESLFWALSNTLDPSKPNVRSAINDFCGIYTTLKASLLAIAYRKASNVEKVLATGTGTTASPATMGFEGSISQADAEAAILATA